MAVGNLLDIAVSAATLRAMEVNQRQRILVDDIHVLVLSPLTRRIVSQSHWAGFLASGYKRFSSRLPVQQRTVAVPQSLRDELLTSYSSATASDLHRLPYYAQTRSQGHPVNILYLFYPHSIPVAILRCQLGRIDVSRFACLFM
jgi:hypothetical protein